MKRGRVKIQKLGGPEGRTRKLTVPADIAAQIPDGSEFEPEITDEGLLYRAVDVPENDRPDWLKGVKADRPRC